MPQHENEKQLEEAMDCIPYGKKSAGTERNN